MLANKPKTHAETLNAELMEYTSPKGLFTPKRGTGNA